MSAPAWAGDRRALARALSLLESTRSEDSAARWALVDEAARSPRDGSLVVGLTGPPGVGKSTLAGRLVSQWRRRGLTVGVIAVDPTSKRSGGALLGDRARMDVPAGDDGVFIRSMAAKDRLGGLAPATHDAVLLMRAIYDRVLVETVGVGQSETDVSTVADVTVVIVQPASGDVLQFIKAGLMEVFDVLVVNKADLGEVAKKTRRDLRSAVRVLGHDGAEVPIISVSATEGVGVDALCDVLDGWTTDPRQRAARLRQVIVGRAFELYGQIAMAKLGGRRGALSTLAAMPGDTAPSALLDAITPEVHHG